MERLKWLRANWDRAGGWSLALLGAVVLYVGWDRVSESGYPAEQLPYILSAGIGGALLVAFGATLLISADLRDEWHKLDRLEKQFDRIERRLAERGLSLDGDDVVAEPGPILDAEDDGKRRAERQESVPGNGSGNGRSRPLVATRSQPR